MAFPSKAWGDPTLDHRILNKDFDRVAASLGRLTMMTHFQVKSQKPCRLLYDYSTASGLLYKNWVTDQEKVGAPRSGASAEDVRKENSVILLKSVIVIMFTFPVAGYLAYYHADE